MAVILVVEDELRQLFVEMLNLMDGGRHHVFTAERGDEAVRKARALEPDLILMDLKLPVMGGVQAIREIREFSDTPIVAITAFDTQGKRDEAMAAGATKYLVKPVDIEVLKAEVETLLKEAPPWREKPASSS